MLAYAPGGLRLQPVSLAPGFGRLGQAGLPPIPLPPPLPTPAPLDLTLPPAIPQAISSIAGTGMAIGLGMVVVSAGASWVGIHTGIKEHGVLSFTGWTVGILAGLGGLMTLATVAGLGVIKSAANSAVANQKNA